MTELRVDQLAVSYQTPHGLLRAVNAASFTVRSGESTALIGESGSGKSTIARAIMGVIRGWSGSIEIDGQTVSGSARSRRVLRATVQMVFQDATGSLNPRMTVGDTLAEANRIAVSMSRSAASRMSAELLESVHLAPEIAASYPSELSGGQQQRVAIARAVARNARILILDEVTSALDVSVQAATLNLLRELQIREGLGYLLISHDLSVVGYMADQVSVLYLGRIVEQGPAETVMSAPQHPYTACLLGSVPRLQGGQPSALRVLVGEIPDPYALPSGCTFHPRCPIGVRVNAERGICAAVTPPLEQGDAGKVACHFPLTAGVSNAVPATSG
jgi:peptide/nickel transport system ATP-binding protein